MIIGCINKGKRSVTQVPEALIWSVRALGVAFYMQTFHAEASGCSSCNPKGAAEKQHQYLSAVLCLKADLPSWRMCRIHHLPAEVHRKFPGQGSLAGWCRIFLSGAGKQAWALWIYWTGWTFLGSLQFQERLVHVLLACCYVFKKCP